MEPQEANGGSASVAIVGLAGRFPGAADLAAWWRNLRDGVESICFFPQEELEESPLTAGLGDHPALVRARGVLDDVEMFDAGFFGYSRRESELMDPQHRVFLECAWEALEDAAIDPAAFAGRIGVFAGCSFNHYLAHHLVSNRHQLGSGRLYQALLENDKDYLAARVSYKLGLTGPSLVVQTACSTSLVAVHLACQSLLNGECDAALAGGISIRVR
jgi:phthiocerol/phenolphthiocerol synthesis type-I polyketide synthase E